MVLIVVAMVLAVAVPVMAWCAARGSLPANGVVGIRTRATRRSPEAWRAAHRAALPVVLAGGVVVLLLAVLAVVREPADPEIAGLVLLGVDVLVLIGAGVVAQRAATA